MVQSQRNRNRSKRRSLYCPTHGCYLDSVSQKYPLHTTKPEHLQQRGMGRRLALTVVAGLGTVPLQGEWLEAFGATTASKLSGITFIKQELTNIP
jgi:hypothetical protein